MKLKEYITEDTKKKADLILIRGIPGSGKSTYAKKHYKGYENFEADQHFMKDGEYKFDFTKLKQAHQSCQTKTEQSLSLGKKVVVSNTFTTLKELKPYLEMAKKLKKEVQVIRMTTQFKNVHGVPEDKLEIMKKRFADFAGEVKV